MPSGIPASSLAAIEKLVKLYRTNQSDYEHSTYNEEDTRNIFIGPLFEALGWDVRNTRGESKKTCDVTLNTTLNFDDGWKVPDYTFRISGTRSFFVEAKKPSLDLETLPEPAQQLRGYARAVNLPLSVLTNFRQFAVYDARYRPKPSDKAGVARLHLFTWDSLLENAEQIWALLSRHAVQSGSIDRFAELPRAGTAPIDEDFLAELDRWRKSLAEAFAKKNPGLSLADLTEAVHATLNRIIFLRFAEGRRLEPFARLRELTQEKGCYAALLTACREADKRYNSGLFDLEGDRLTPGLALDDSTLRELMEGLYFPKSPYAFSQMPPEVLGHAYERFLSAAIELKPSGKPRIVPKPEVTKASGVYYTPSWVVRYLVERTLGPACRGRSPKQLARFRVLDPACGSGSFLLGALDWFLRYYLDWYVANGPRKWSEAVFEEDGEYRLTAIEKGRIARTHIFGVDIDRQAVEVAKLSLLLKIIDEETLTGIDVQRKMFHERALPTLESNLRWGNSLIGNDFFVQRRFPATEKELLLLRPFDYSKAFPAAHKDGGFDVVIGNPPYLNVDDTWGNNDLRLTALKALYPDIYNDKTDILFYFLGRGLTLSKGATAFIVSRAFLEAFKADKLRKRLGPHVEEIVDFRNYPVFPGVGISSAIVVAQHSAKKKGSVYRMRAEALRSFDLAANLAQRALFERSSVARSAFGAASWNFASPAVRKLNSRIDKAGVPLSDVAHIGQGMQTGCNEVFGKRSAAEIKSWKVPHSAHFRRAANSDIEAFVIRDRGEHLLYLEDFGSLAELPVGLRQYLEANAKALKNRAAFRRGNCEWWKYTWPLHRERYFKSRRILSPYISAVNRFALDETDSFVSLTDTTVLFVGDLAEDIKYLLGVLNSRLLTFRFRSIGKLKGGDQYEYFENTVARLAVRRIDFAKKSERKLHDEIVTLAGKTIATSKALPSVSATGKTLAAAHLAALREEIDERVERLYGVTPKEVRTIRSELER